MFGYLEVKNRIGLRWGCKWVGKGEEERVDKRVEGGKLGCFVEGNWFKENGFRIFSEFVGKNGIILEIKRVIDIVR